MSICELRRSGCGSRTEATNRQHSTSDLPCGMDNLVCPLHPRRYTWSVSHRGSRPYRSGVGPWLEARRRWKVAACSRHRRCAQRPYEGRTLAERHSNFGGVLALNHVQPSFSTDSASLHLNPFAKLHTSRFEGKGALDLFSSVVVSSKKTKKCCACVCVCESVSL